MANEEFDLVVIGAGITGAGVALDAAARGLNVALIDRGDFAEATSSRSSKFVHGGLRYLQQGDYRLVYEALHERQRLLRNAPHLVSVLPFLLPVMGKNGVISPRVSRALGTAMWLYDVTGGWRVGALHQRISAAQAQELCPMLPARHLGPSYLYFDCTADDARLTLTVARTATTNFGAAAATHVSAIGLEKSPGGVIRGVRVLAHDTDGDLPTDRTIGAEFVIRTRAVVNATGVFVDDVRVLDEAVHPNSIRPAKGVHVVVPAESIPCSVAVVLPVRKDKRSIFVAPWGNYTYIGTTDTDFDGDPTNPTCTEDDVEYLLGATNLALGTSLTPADVTGRWAGLRPLVAAEHPTKPTRTADLSRNHSLSESISGLFTITGGKLTTYRLMAEDTVDTVVARCFSSRSAEFGSSPTGRLPLLGVPTSPSRAQLSQRLRWKRNLQPPFGGGHSGTNPVSTLERYGSERAVLESLIVDNPQLARTIVDGFGHCAAEVVFAVRFEMATSLSDVLLRRTRCGIIDRKATLNAASAVAEIMASELDWTPQRVANELETFHRCLNEAIAADPESSSMTTMPSPSPASD